jgi:heat shock protein HslJ
LRVVNNNGSVELRQIRITVEPATAAPIINYFNANPPSIQAGHCTELSWQVTGSVDRVDITRSGTVIWGSAPLSGRLQECLNTAGTIEYSLEASGPGGASRKVTYVTVAAVVNTPTPTPVATSTPAPQPPVIYSFAVNPTQITVNECVTVTWNTGGGTTYVRIMRDGQTLLDHAPLVGTVQDCLSNPGAYNYGVEVRNAAGQTDFRDQSVTVNESVPDNPLANTNWTLTGASSPGTIFVLIPGTTISASFSADWQLSGTAGCNTYSSSYTTNGGQIAITVPASTNISCASPEGVMQQEASYLSALPTMATYQISGNQLTMKDGSGQSTLTFQALP